MIPAPQREDKELLRSFVDFIYREEADPLFALAELWAATRDPRASVWTSIAKSAGLRGHRVSVQGVARLARALLVDELDELVRAWIDALVALNKDLKHARSVQLFQPSVLSMAVGRFLVRTSGLPSCEEVEAFVLGPFPGIEAAASVLMALSKYVEPDLAREFLYQWSHNGYPIVRCGHKLAASLALTDPPKTLQAPWRACFVTLPDDLAPGFQRYVGVLRLEDEESGKRGVELVVSLTDGNAMAICLSEPFDPSSISPNKPRQLTPEQHRLREVVMTYALNAVASVSGEHVDVRKVEPKRGTKHRNRGKGQLPEPYVIYELRAPVKIDAREMVRDYVSGARKGGRPKVQFVVRGHWRNQACGPKLRERRLHWIEPFWKGPVDAKAIIRGYEVERGACYGDGKGSEA